MFNKAILKNFVIKQFEKQAAEQAKEQAMQQQQMPPQQMMSAQQQQMPMAQAGTSVTEEPITIMGTGFNPNAGVDMRFIDDFKTYVVEPGTGTARYMRYEGPSNEGRILDDVKFNEYYVDPRVISNVKLKNAVDVKFEGTIEEEEKMLKKLNRRNFLGSRGFRGRGWKTGLSDEEIREFKEENPFYKKDRTREVSYDLTNPDPSRKIYYNSPKTYLFQNGGPNPPEADPEVTETSEGIYYDPVRGVGDTIDGQQYWYPDSVNVVYDEDDIYESIFDPRIAEKRAANDAARRAYNDAVKKREQEIAEIEKAKALYNEVWYVDFPDTIFNTINERKKWQENNPKWREAKRILEKYGKADSGTNAPITNKAGFPHTPYYDPTADLSDLYPEEVAPLSLPYDIQYNLSDLPEDVDEGQFRQWINTYYPDYAKEHGIDPTVPRNAMNNIIKSAWYELGSEYLPYEPLPLKPYTLLEPELDRDIIRPEIEKDSRKIVRLDAGQFIGYPNKQGDRWGPPAYAKVPGYYDLSTATWMGEDYVPPTDSIDKQIILDFFSKKDGGISIDPAKKGTFKAQATRMGMGVQEAANAILNAPEGKYSPEMRKKANFAKNFAKENGGSVRRLKLPQAQNGGFNWGPTDAAEREKLHEKIRNGEVQDVILTLKDDKALIDGIANWGSVTGIDNINPAFNDQIKNRLYSGKWGYNPKTGYLVNLAKAKADKTTSLPESEKKYLKDRETFWKDEMADFEKDRVPVQRADTEAWVPDFEFETYNGTMNALDVMRKNQESGNYGQTVYMTPQEKATYAKRMMQNNWEHTVNHPLWTLPGQIYLGAFAGPATFTSTLRGAKPVLNTGKNLYNKYGRSSALLDKGVKAATQNSPRAQQFLLKGSKYGTIDNALALKAPFIAYQGAKSFYNDPSWSSAGMMAYGTAGSLWPFLSPKFMGQ